MARKSTVKRSRRPGKCPTPWKRELTQAQAKADARRLNAEVRGTCEAYLCPSGKHWHTGNPRANRNAQAAREKARKTHRK